MILMKWILRACAFVAILTNGQAYGSQVPDLVLVNGNIITVDSKDSIAQADPGVFRRCLIGENVFTQLL